MMLQLSGGRLDLDEGAYDRGGGDVERLTDTERRLLRYLAERIGRAVSREELQREVWGYRAGVLSRTVFTTVGRIRGKLEADPARPHHLLTAAGEGYVLVVDDAPRPRRASRGPLPSTRLVGRDGVLTDLDGLVGRARLVSLLGPGGVGKTRLAVELLSRREGVFVALEPVDEVGRVPAAVASALGAPLTGGGDAWTELTDLVGDAALLLILDNAEHLDGLADRLRVLLEACPGLTLLVTTRVRLGLRLETAFVVQPLGLPVAPDGLDRSEAGVLLLEHAARVRPGWVPDLGEAAVLAAVCAQVGGSPLALELAASWLRLLEPADLLAELESSVRLPSLDRDIPDRHRSMAVALDASWRLLATQTARVLEALAVFCTPFDRVAATAVAGADLLTLGQLVDASMVHRVGAQFDLHPLVRADARARIAVELDRSAEVAARHARWFLGRLDTDAIEDVLAAWDWAVRSRDGALLTGAAYPLYRYLDRRNSHAELIRALERAGDVIGEPGARAALRLLGAGAGAVPREALTELVAALGSVSRQLRAAARVHASIVAQLAGDLPFAVGLAAEAVEEADGDPSLLAFARSVGGTALMRAGDLDRAREELRASIASSGDDRLAGRPMVHLGEVELAAGNLVEAREVLRCALEVCRMADDRTFAAHALGRLGQALAALGEDPVPVWVEAIGEAYASRLPRVWWASALVGLGGHWAEAGRVAGLELLAAAASGASMEQPGAIEARLRAFRDRWPQAAWSTATRRGRALSDVEVIAFVRGVAAS